MPELLRNARLFSALLALSLMVQCVSAPFVAASSTATAQPFSGFAGVSTMETREDPASGAPVVTFGSDIPFHYQIQILGSDRVLFRLYHARLADSLVGADGVLNLKSSAAGWSARLKNPPHTRYPVSIEYQELILTAPGLGTRKIQVIGADELPLALPAVSTEAAQMTTSRAKAQHADRAARRSARRAPVEIHDKAPSIGAGSESALPNTHSTDNDPKKQPVRNGKAHARRAHGPMIEAIRNAPAWNAAGPNTAGWNPSGRNLPNLASLSGQPDAGDVVYRLRLQPNRPSTGPVVVSAEGSDRKLRPLPRYTGGAKPIRAITLDEEGHAQIVRPKNDPLPAFDLSANGDGDGYNVLFQAEGNDSSAVGRLMSEALTAYRGRQPRRALQLIEQALRLNQADADLYAALGEIQWSLSRKDVALEAYRKAVGLVSDRYDGRYAQLLVSAGKTVEAVRFLEAYDHRRPNQAQIVYTLATLYEESGRSQQALERLRQAAQLNPDSTDIQVKLGQAYELNGDAASAKKHYAEALKLSPGASDIESALARVSAGRP